MKRAYVVTEGLTDVEILKKILPKNIVRNIEFVAGSGSSSALSFGILQRHPLIAQLDTFLSSVLVNGKMGEAKTKL
jgi:hypothetical protein